MNLNGKNHHSSSLTSERTQMIRLRIAQRFYDRDDVLLEVAKRILESHDLDDLKNNNKSRA